jgi:glycosyltransferase involved in cell wall biosynthesis
MRLAFVDSSGWNYDASTPYEQPMGGSQSALCYLAAELIHLGHEVSVFRGTHGPSISFGVIFQPQADAEEHGALNTFDTVIALNAVQGRAFRDRLGVTVPLLLWLHHAVIVPSVQALRDTRERAAWDGIAFVSASQRAPYLEEFGIDPAKTAVMHNGVSPAFEVSICPVKEPPVLFYTSTPYRGLDVLLAAFPAIRAATGARLRVFSSMAVYRGAEAPFQALYERARCTEGVEYAGSLGQRQLAAELAGATALAHPSTYPECHSIAAIEAMATGAAVFTTDLGGQREATGGMARMIPVQADKGELAKAFAGLVVTELRRMKADPVKAKAERSERIQYVRDHYLWKDRAKAWDEWLRGRQPAPPDYAITRDTAHSSRA